MRIFSNAYAQFMSALARVALHQQTAMRRTLSHHGEFRGAAYGKSRNRRVLLARKVSLSKRRHAEQKAKHKRRCA